MRNVIQFLQSTKNFVKFAVVEKRKATESQFRRIFSLSHFVGKKSQYCLVTFVPLVNISNTVNKSLVSAKTIVEPISSKQKLETHVSVLKDWLLKWISSCKQISLLTIRAFQLSGIFLPLLVFYPIVSFKFSWKSLWFDIVIKALELSGPVYIKFGQWASTRRDIFSIELCNKLEKLQTRTSPHLWKHTEKELESVFGSEWQKIFVKFDNNQQPVGSGCVAQVYKAWIKLDDAQVDPKVKKPLRERKVTMRDSQCDNRDAFVPVAVKVLHPGIKEAFERDLALMKFGAKFISALFPSLKWINLSACLDEFANVMSAQIDLRVEAENLRRFSRNFAQVSQIRFPKPYGHLVHSSILVETFEEGEPVIKFVHDSKESDSNFEAKRRVLAKLGAQTLLKMVFIDNFVHGDLHPGNILVQENKSLVNKEIRLTNSEEEVETDPFSAFNDLILGDRIFRLPTLRSLSEINTKADDLRLVILDCGIVSLLRREKMYQGFRDTFRAIVSGEGEKVGDLFLERSEHECNNAQEFRRGMDHIVQTARQQSITLAKLSISTLMQQVFNLLMQHHVRLESEFSTVMLAVMILEGLGRSLDPNLDLLKEATPFLWTGT